MKTTRRLLLGSGLLILFATAPARAATVMHFWDFEAGYADLVGAAEGSVTGATTVGSATGHAGSGLAATTQASVSGANDCIAVSGSNFFAPGTGAFSMSYWFRLPNDGAANPRGIFDFSGNGGDGPQSLITATGNLAFRVDGVGSANAVVNIPVTEDDQWHFVVANFSSATGLQVHVDGAGIDGSAAGFAAAVTFNASSYIGTFNFSGATANNGLAGAVDDIAVYSGTLSDAEINGLFDGSLTPLSIPEPSSVLLGGLALGILFRRRR